MTQDYSCSNRNKCRIYRNCDVDEMPVRDTQKTYNPPKLPHESPSPPHAQNGDWDLQYCQWSGWTWVKKTDKEVISKPNPQLIVKSQKNKKTKTKKGCFCCFKSKNSKQQNEIKQPPKVQIKSVEVPPPKVEKKTSANLNEEKFHCCCAIECCPCSQMCCPCMNQVCCCMCDEVPQQKKTCRCAETQTTREVREQATKVSEIEIPKRRNCCPTMKRCLCRRPVCCPCRRVCCDCCSCKCNQNNSTDHDDKRNKNFCVKTSKNTDQILNYCLPNNLRKPNVIDILNHNSSNFPALHKSLDLLLRNNVNIMGLFEDKKEMKYDKLDSFLSSNDTISSLSSDNLKKHSDSEHCKLLTAVCDAILSSHKFDNKSNPTVVHLQPTYKHYEPQESYSVYNRNLLEKILTDLSLTTHKDIGVQVNKNISPNNESFFQPKRSFTKLTRKRSRTLAAPRFPQRVEALRRNIDMLRFGSSRRKRSVEKKVEEGNSRSIFKSAKDDSSAHKKLIFDFESTKNKNKPKPESLKLENLENLLDSIEFLDASTMEIYGPESSSDKEKTDEVLSPFTDSEILLKRDHEPR